MDNWGGDHTVASIVNDRVLTVIVDGAYYTISMENENFDNARLALNNKDLDALLEALKPIEAIKRVILTTGAPVEVGDDYVLYAGEPVRGIIVDRILEFAREGYDYEPLTKFLAHLQENPSRTVVEEFYEWLEAAKTPMPITEDGCFLAYKKVRNDFKDGYSGTLDYSVGNVVEIPRNKVDDNRNNECSYGLHFCSIGYLPGFGAGPASKVIICKINPRDVVAFPRDSNIEKGRTCRIEVIGLHTRTDTEEAWEGRGFVDTREEYGVDDDDYYEALDEEGEDPVPTAVGTRLFFNSRQDAREYTYGHGGSVQDNGYYAQPSRWEVVGATPVTPKGKYFTSRENARNHARCFGGRVVDRGWNEVERWEVV